MIAALPRRLGALRLDPVTPPSRLVHAWGSPAVVVRCGVPATVRELGRTEASVALADADGRDRVLWFERVAGGSQVWTAVLPAAAVSVTIPHAYPEQAPYLQQLDPVLKSTLG
jgi:hypothetical protein